MDTFGSKSLYCTMRSLCTMRPEIDDGIVDRLKEWARVNHPGNLEDFGKRGGHSSYYNVNDALNDLLKEVGF